MADTEPATLDLAQPYPARVRLGLLVALGLAVLTVVEYVVAVNVERPMVWLVPFMAVKGGLILEYFMHVSALKEEAH